MIAKDNIHFHNVADMASAPGGGYALHRFPRRVLDDPELSPGGHAMCRMAAKCELRFRSGPLAKLFLASTGKNAWVTVYRGDLLTTGKHVQLTQGVNEMGLTIPTIEAAAKPEVYPSTRFPRDLWRVVIRSGNVSYHGIDGMGHPITAPEPGDTPSVRMLSYGSSITMAMGTFTGYAEAAAEEMGWDSYNLGMAGTCRIERRIADWIAERNDWDVATFELGANMIGSFEPEAFEARCRYLVEACLHARSSTKILLISIPDFSADARIEPDLGARHTVEYRKILARLQDELDVDGRLHYIDGRDLSVGFRGYMADLNHPDIPAYIRMGMRLADRLRTLR